ncbi:phosphatidate cytidylyltransferase [Glutamicibacter nicotianae]|uniref:phosphatidate cytidylyltransferase n=1 Tax=Glutamicibacter nicotianae TaxID=37929 RepID=UPI001EF8A27F|nr:phosphatidate cytidylyltransferase [Glutamicibacter nicotianae]MBM7767821.1 phosphatidate cytidylyltransferase [Glutamicibacter nicotianae]
MPGSTDNTEGNASAVPSVASGESQPLTRREARARREAAAKGKKRGFMKNRGAKEAPEPATGIQEPVNPAPATAVPAPPAMPTTVSAVKPDAGKDAALPTPQPAAAGSQAVAESTGKADAAKADTGQAKERAKAAFKADLSKPVKAEAQASAMQAEPAKPAQSAAPGKDKTVTDPAAEDDKPEKAESATPEAASATQNPAPADSKLPAPPVSDSTDLAETGKPDAEEADIPAELLIGTPEPKKSRAGRNLPAAIGVGVLLLGVVLVGLLWFHPLLVIALIALSCIGCWEVARATTHAKTSVPQLPLYLSSILLPASAIWGGVEALGFSYIACILIALLFRLMDGAKGAVASVMSSVFIISWVPLLLSFALLILDSVNGQWLIATLLLLAVANDTFGYIVGVLIGKHPMAPKISPKKSWEGFAGSMLGSMAIGASAMHFWMGMPWWTGVILAFFTTIAATTGDFSESMVKRELGIKDMSNLLPGHGGIMDRLDSVLFVIPLGYVISHVLAWSVAVF